MLGMVMDNRYFPLFPQLYNGSDHNKSHFRADGFILASNNSWRIKPGSNPNEQRAGYPELSGTLDLYDLGKAAVTSGFENPIPNDWRALTELKMDMNGTFQGQGIAFQNYVPISKHIGIGGSFFLLRLCSQANITPTADAKDRMNLNAPGNEVKFIETLEKFENLAGTQSGFLVQNGISDLELNVRWFEVQDYTFACRKIDYSMTLGLLIPTGIESSKNNIASVPFGGEGFWGWYIGPQMEIELKEDWKAGFIARIQKRFAKTINRRIPVDIESTLFSPLTGDVYVNPGTNFTFSPYAVLEDVQSGFGAQCKYTLTWHEKDEFTDKRSDQTIPSNFTELRKNSRWVQEYLTLGGFYDYGHNKDLKNKLLFSFSWDLSTNFVAARGSSITHRVALGLTVDF